MIVIETVFVAFAMFSVLPLPRPEWNAGNMRYALCAFPLIGLVCGGLWWGWSIICALLSVPAALRGAGLCLIPVLVTGGIHLDGYADTCDALASCASSEKKQEILKDPRCGAFAVIRLCAWFTTCFALCTALEPDGRAVGCMALAFVLERALSGLAVARFPLAKNSGLAHTFATAADRKSVGRILAVLCVLTVCSMFALGGVTGLAMAAAGLLVFWHYHGVAGKQLGGLSGDLAGWFLQRAELWMLGALVACQLIEENTMIFITGPLYSGKREYACQLLDCKPEELAERAVWDVQDLAADCTGMDALAEELSWREVVIATEVGGGIVPVDAGERAAREAAGQLSCLLAQRAEKVVRVFCGLPVILKESVL